MFPLFNKNCPLVSVTPVRSKDIVANDSKQLAVQYNLSIDMISFMSISKHVYFPSKHFDACRFVQVMKVCGVVFFVRDGLKL